MLENSAQATHSANDEKVWALEGSNDAINRNTITNDVTRLLNALEADNVIDNSTNSVSVKNNWLYIDGKKQPQDINDKYFSYFDGKGDFVTSRRNP